MATLNIKNFPDDLYRRLKSQAKKRGRSLAGEVTVMLQEQVLRPKKYSILDWPQKLGGLWAEGEFDEYLEKERNSW